MHYNNLKDLSFTDCAGLYRSRRPGKGPVTMRLGPISMYLIMGADNIQAIFRNSRHLSFEFMQLRIAHKVKGLPLSDVAKLNLDDSGTGAVSLSGLAGDERIWHKLHDIYLRNLTERSAVDFLTSKFVQEFAKQLEEVPWSQNSTGIYAFLQQYQFYASTITLVGPRILSFGQDKDDGENRMKFSGTFWDYDAAFMTLLQVRQISSLALGVAMRKQYRRGFTRRLHIEWVHSPIQPKTISLIMNF